MASHHTFGDSCMLKEESNTFTRRASSVALEPPKITAQFFYCSGLPIDDPLAAIPLPSAASATRSARVPPRPFSVHDNLALDQAWLKLQQDSEPQERSSALRQARLEKRAVSREDHSSEPHGLTMFSKEPGNDGHAEMSPFEDPAFEDSSIRTQAIKTEADVGKVAGSDNHYGPGARSRTVDSTLHDDASHQPLKDTMPVSAEEIVHEELETSLPGARRRRSFFHRREKEESATEDVISARSSTRRLSRGRQDEDEATNLLGRSPDTTGTPFLRVPARLRRSRSRSPNQEAQNLYLDGAISPERDYRPKQSSPLGANTRFSRLSIDHGLQDEDLRREAEATRVTIGVSRLHVVEMPSLKMAPIYWDPVHDVSSVVRGTWFYKDTMWPVESELANRIEEGYEYMKPWTPTYVDELNSCVEIGAEAELKVVHKIWPEEGPEATSNWISASPQNLKEQQDIHKAKAVAGLASNRAAGSLEGFEPAGTGRLFARSSIIYANGKDAQILKQSQLPSAAKGRRPLGNIRKGRAVGIPVVRGFDMRAWEKINPLPNRAVPVPQPMSAGTANTLKRRKSCIACEDTHERPMPTDLILVVHGIGQKLSERVESFHFTHAINSFRRQVNLELNDTMVKPWLRQDLGGIMVLPINWRSTLKLDDAGLDPDPNRKASDGTKNQFTLKDITAESLPAVRNLISDVMLDIPYYLSHHKPRMIEAVIGEANRVYRLWCNNNPGFHQSGRVHLLAHSLGSVMALDILSKQPTDLPQQVDFPNRSNKIRTDMFEFDTKSLFFCGSPAGFFLLLNRAPLVPRKGRKKPNAEAEGLNADVAGNPGTFGCLAVDNLYNIMHYNDPVSYCLNACVDVDYAASLRPATVPSARVSWGQYLGSYFRGKTITPTQAMAGLNELPRRPTTARLPTTVELETHNFSKEEIAEKRMFLLNDNGQIDYTLPSGGGPLEIQYLNMLGAHSSYWTRQDFVRFLVVEVGRKQGKTETVNSFKAVKKAFRKK